MRTQNYEEKFEQYFPHSTLEVSSLGPQGMDINAADAHGDTPLHIAARLGERNLIEYLIKNGALLDRVNIYWELPFECLPQEFSELKSLFPESACVINRNRTFEEIPEILKKSLIS